MAVGSFLDFRPSAAVTFRTGRLDRPQQEFFRRRYSDLYNQFVASQAGELQEGRLPRQRFTDFLGEFDFERYFQSFAPRQRGERPSAFVPRTRFLTGF